MELKEGNSVAIAFVTDLGSSTISVSSHLDMSSTSSQESSSRDVFVTVSEEILHSDAECDVDIYEKRFPSAANEKSSTNSFDSVDIFVDLSLNETGISEVRLRQEEPSKNSSVELNFRPKTVFCNVSLPPNVWDVTVREEDFNDVCNATVVDLNNYEDSKVDLASEQSTFFSISASGDHFSTSLPSCTSMISMASTDIRKELLLFGQSNVGPILPTTRRIFLIRLKKLRLGQVESPKTCLANFSEGNLQKLGSLIQLDNEMCRKFVDLSCDTKSNVHFLTRDGVLRSSFNYLLLDPRLTKNLPLNYTDKSEQESWNVFLSAIFYVGKGTRSRPFNHLYEAVKRFDRYTVSKSFRIFLKK